MRARGTGWRQRHAPLTRSATATSRTLSRISKPRGTQVGSCVSGRVIVVCVCARARVRACWGGGCTLGALSGDDPAAAVAGV